MSACERAEFYDKFEAHAALTYLKCHLFEDNYDYSRNLVALCMRISSETFNRFIVLEQSEDNPIV
ncbi:hypothetical protein BHYA_0002g01090 [Botrytis hyacinthi]|uniref:Uncharacterized protein n=1 Tax=Botrytis hyacinthi TaxID=278943 RepID=A0A4Z1H254_9HELO|nr:hypothetical protein BHYA_0002g01090 [Botrytis hyacinthi]